ncbi:MAG: Peptidyl-prolyl cis-trans isomerase B [Candidatus Woesebacteria bacterium GW2011_GWA1_37_8]|uniref:Peptidyl-prolyl cis-trans isomerase B n=2 Tax=Candidatus Woeseibacteriota TaxID=1752722 RepID=A0A0G0L472_9BACT|nr:MAG: Peptidyl-prolyl cis-trans isomerase B [Candidatus Woesebacteria bacterium GW2011_GWA1_37_8]KKQ86778.1 MAG: Peptidyl-prolyl cis-trans isomerase B [Candidatus Woesebacteria bacterium GW2011_GWB1_38_8b]
MEELSRKERRKLLREQKKSEKQNQKVFVNLKKLFITLFGCLVIGFFGFKVYKWATAPVPTVSGVSVEAKDDDWIKGNKDASITLIEYSDFQCPACKTYAPMIKKLSEEYKDNIKVVYRHYPLPQHKNAKAAAYGAEAAGKQGKFWEMHDLLFEKQEEWSNEGDITEKLSIFAESLGLNKDEWRADYESQEVKDAVNADVTLANMINLSSTPTFLLNGEKITIRNYEDIKSKVEEKLKSN